MSTADNEAPATPAILIYDRIDLNRRATRLLIACFIVLILPALAFLVEYGTVWLAMLSLSVMPAIQDEQKAIRVMLLLGATTLFGLLLLAVYKYLSAADATLQRVGARAPRPEEADFVRLVENLCIGAGLPLPTLHVIDTWLPNALSVGFSPERASLVVTKGLLALLDRRELEGVIAHELSHIGNGDSRLNTVLAVMLRTLIIPLPIQAVLWIGMIFSLPLLLSGQELFDDFPPGARLLIGAQTILVFWALLWPWIGRLVQRAVSRRREFLADADAALLTRYPEGLARALVKVSHVIQASGPRAAGARGLATPALSHLFLVTPVAMLSLFDPHPPANARVSILANAGAGIPASTLERAARDGADYFTAHKAAICAPPASFEALDWLPNTLTAAGHGVKFGLLGMAAFFIYTLALAIMLGAAMSDAALSSQLTIAASLGYAVAGYSAARQLAPERRLALLATCFVLYMVWLPAGLLTYLTFERIGTAGGAGALVLKACSGAVLVMLGGACGAAAQAVFSLLSTALWRSPPTPADAQQTRSLTARTRSQASNAPSDSATHTSRPPGTEASAPDKMPANPPDVPPEMPPSPFVPAPEHRIKCPHCGVTMADTDATCVWCGHTRSPPDAS